MNRVTRRRYEIFVGSTFKELKKARQHIIDAILLAGHIPCSTELWPAESQAPTEVIKDYLYPCDIHVLIIGYRYGSLVPNQQVSFAHWEYLQSKGKRPLLVFMQEDAEVDKARIEMRKNFPNDPDNDREKLLRAFRAELRKQDNFMLVSFSNTEAGVSELAGQCIAALGRLTTSGQLKPSSGWIRADGHDGETLLAIEGNPFLKRVMDQIRQFEVLARRVTQNVAAKEAMARHFWFYMQSRIRDWAAKQGSKEEGGKNLFFESGSSLAYVSLQFENAVLNEAGIREDWHIRTNNILCLLQFDLHTANDARCFPDGKPDPLDKYGAIFPQEWGVLHREPPIVPRKQLSAAENAAVNKLRAEFRRYKDTFVLAAASGWDIDSEVPFRGPHVGSHKNMLFKRVIFTSGYPVVLFIDAEKLGFKRQPNCYPVFDLKYSVARWLKEFPVAICVGWELPEVGTEQPASLMKLLEGRAVKDRNVGEYVKGVLREWNVTEEYFLQESVDEHSGVRSGAVLLGNKMFAQVVPRVGG